MRPTETQKAKPKGKKKTSLRVSARAFISMTIFLCVVMMGVKIQDMVAALARGEAPAGISPAHAETKAEAPEAKKTDEKKVEGAGEEKKATDTDISADASDAENYSEAEVNILKRLSERRQELEKRAREMDQREALVHLTEQRVEKKMEELKAAQEQLRAAIGEAAGEQKKRAESLVKIYETMKPKEAARIFETLDIQTLLAVVSNMKEARVAPILAAMEPMKARAVTTALMEKKPLPSIPQ